MSAGMKQNHANQASSHSFKIGLALSAGALGWLLIRQGLRAGRAARFQFKNKVVLITGGSRGLGLDLAREIAQEGAILVLCARNQEELERVRPELISLGARVHIEVCDISDEDNVEIMLKRVAQAFGHIDVLINNAGQIQVGPIDVMGVEQFHSIMNVNFFGAVYTTIKALPYLKRAKQPKVINITSFGGVVPVPHLLPYCSSKFAMVGFSEGLRVELDRHGIGVTTVVPGLMRTGSATQAEYRGDVESESHWFIAGATAPGLSLNARTAARRIINAARLDEGFVVLGWPAKVMRLGYVLMPNFVVKTAAFINRQMPFRMPEALQKVQRRELSENAREHNECIS
jgi:short-subunit dehydrogenase